MIRLKRGRGDILTLDKELASGGEGKIYSIYEEPYLVAKLYHPNKLTPEYAPKLQAMLRNPPRDSARQQGCISIAWPTEPLFNVQWRFVGFLMPYVDHSFSFPLLKLYNPQDRQQTLSRFTWQYLLHTASNLASVLAAFHASGYVIGDLNESNVLVNGSALVTLVDCDSIQVPQGYGQVYRCSVGKPEYTPPELQGRDFSQIDRAVYHDNFGLAVLIFLLLMEGLHPFAGVWQGVGTPPTREQNIQAGNCPYIGSRLLTPPPRALPFNTLPPALQRLMVQCFADGYRYPQRRPTALEWLQALNSAERYLTFCRVNGQHCYSRHLSACPWCERIRWGVPDPFPPLIQQTVIRQTPLSPIYPTTASLNQTTTLSSMSSKYSAHTSVPLGGTGSSTKTLPPVNPSSTYSKRPQKHARIIVLSNGQSILLDKELMVVGRQDPTLGIFPEINLADKTVGRRHAYLRNQQGQFTVEDLNALNKTRLNGVTLTPYEERTLKDGDILRFGSVEVRFELRHPHTQV